MTETEHRPSRSIWGAVVLIALGVLLLLANLGLGFNPWALLARFWPLILIFLGIGGLIDYFRVRSDPTAPHARNSVAIIGLVFVVILFALAFEHHRQRWNGKHMHEDRAVDLGGATSVDAHITMPAGSLAISPGGSSLLDAHFDYIESDGDPQVNYTATGGIGQLEISQTQPAIHMGTSDDSWQLRFANDVPLDLSLDMGAGQGELDLRGLDLTNLKINLGAGQLQLDLRGARKNDLDADVEGGVGQATIKLPQDVGVRVHAEGGLGTISVHGLTRDGDDYVNDALGKSPATIRLTVEGGVGTIDLDAEPSGQE
ncbi:MAG: toast rack family protein [Candidatus Acidiferrales bacterium]